MKELDTFKALNVYEEVKDNGQDRISLRWVISEKMVGKGKTVKARLVCRGFKRNVQYRRIHQLVGRM